LVIAEERERRRIAADLHDHVSQSLAFARLRLAKAQKAATDTKQMVILGDISESLLQAIQDTKNLIFDLSPPLLTDIGLEAAISEWLENHVENEHGIKTKFIEDGQPLSLDKDLSVMLYRIVRELLANVVRHSEATHVTVQVKRSAANISIVVEDNGVGFDAGMAPGSIDRGNDFGLFNINERIIDLGGSMEIASEPDQGCRTILIVPIS
jgi:signal transduction histidine kinase